MPVKGEGYAAPDHVMALLGELMDELRRDVQEAQAQDPDLGEDLRTLRPSQLRLLSLTPSDGLRVTALAERLSMTKQALGEFATALEDRGLLESVHDPADRRVRILRPTQRGRDAAAQGTEVIAAVEERWRNRLGAQKWDQLRRLLREAATSGVEDVSHARVSRPGP